jgi:hypothetical protein
LNPDVKQFGPMTFTLDEQAPRQVLCNLIDSSLRTADLQRALDLAETAKKTGYLQPGEFFYPPLELVCVKARSIAESPRLERR